MWRKLATNKNDTKSNQVDKNCPTSNPLTKNVHVIRDILDIVQSLHQSKTTSCCFFSSYVQNKKTLSRRFLAIPPFALPLCWLPSPPIFDTQF